MIEGYNGNLVIKHAMIMFSYLVEIPKKNKKWGRRDRESIYFSDNY